MSLRSVGAASPGLPPRLTSRRRTSSANAAAPKGAAGRFKTRKMREAPSERESASAFGFARTRPCLLRATELLFVVAILPQYLPEELPRLIREFLAHPDWALFYGAACWGRRS